MDTEVLRPSRVHRNLKFNDILLIPVINQEKFIPDSIDESMFLAAIRVQNNNLRSVGTIWMGAISTHGDLIYSSSGSRWADIVSIGSI